MIGLTAAALPDRRGAWRGDQSVEVLPRTGERARRRLLPSAILPPQWSACGSRPKRPGHPRTPRRGSRSGPRRGRRGRDGGLEALACGARRSLVLRSERLRPLRRGRASARASCRALCRGQRRADASRAGATVRGCWRAYDQSPYVHARAASAWARRRSNTRCSCAAASPAETRSRAIAKAAAACSARR